MVYLLTFLWCLPSGFLWFFNGELWVVGAVTQNPEAMPWLIALCAVTAQFIGYSALYHFASAVLVRFAFVRKAVDKVKAKTKIDERAGWGTYTLFMTGGIVGIPPLLALYTIYGSAKAGPLWKLIACSMPMRVIWYMVWAYAPEFLRNLGFGS